MKDVVAVILAYLKSWDHLKLYLNIIFSPLCVNHERGIYYVFQVLLYKLRGYKFPEIRIQKRMLLWSTRKLLSSSCGNSGRKYQVAEGYYKFLKWFPNIYALELLMHLKTEDKYACFSSFFDPFWAELVHNNQRNNNNKKNNTKQDQNKTKQTNHQTSIEILHS